MPPKKSRRKKGKRRTKAEAAVEAIVEDASVVEIIAEDTAKKEAEREFAKLVELKKAWKEKMCTYVKFVALGVQTHLDTTRRRRGSYLMASGQTASARRRSIATKVIDEQLHFPLAFKVLTLQYNTYPSEVVIDIDPRETLKSIEQKLINQVGPQRTSGHDGSESPFPETPTPDLVASTIATESSTAAAAVTLTAETLTATPLAATPLAATSTPLSTFGLSFFYTPPGSLQRRRLATETEWQWALKDFHGRRGAVTLDGVHAYSKKILHRLRAHHADAALNKDKHTTSESIEAIHQIWQFSAFIDAHHYISTEEIDLLCHQLGQSRRAAVRSHAAGALWAFAYNHHLRSQIHKSAVLVTTLTNPKFLQSCSNFADSDKESIRLHTYIFGLLACILSEGQLASDDILGDGGTSLLGTYLRAAPGGSTTPQGTRLAAQALLDSCIRSVSAQHRIGRASNSEAVAQADAGVAAAQEEAEKKKENIENAALLEGTSSNLLTSSTSPLTNGNDSGGEMPANSSNATSVSNSPVIKVNLVSILGKCLTTIKDSVTFRHVLDIVVLCSRSPSNELRDALCTTTTSAGYSVAASLLGVLNDLQQGIHQFENISTRVREELIVRVLAALWGVLESASRSPRAKKRGVHKLMAGVASPQDVAVEMLHLARTLASRQNRNRSETTTVQQAYCAVNCVMCLATTTTTTTTNVPSTSASAPTTDQQEDIALQLFSDLSALYDEAADGAANGLRQFSNPTIQPPDISSHGHGWSSVRRRAACTMAILTSSSTVLCQDLSHAGYFERLVAQVEEEQIQEKQRYELQRRRSLAKVAAVAFHHNVENKRVGEDRAQSLSSEALGKVDTIDLEPTGCEWLLRALANMAATESREPLSTSVVETCCRLLLDPTDRRANIIRPIGDGLDSVILLLWRLGSRFKDHRMSMMLDDSVINLLLQAATSAYNIGRMRTVESVLCLVHLLVSDIMGEREEDVRKGEEPKGIRYVQSLPVVAFEGWVSFLLNLVQECCGDSAFKSSTRLLVRTRTIKVSNSSSSGVGVVGPPPSGTSIKRPGFRGRTNRNSNNGLGAGMSKQVQAPDVFHGMSNTTATDKKCRVWTLAVTNLWAMSISRTLGFLMLDGGLPSMLTRLCLERSSRLTPLLRIRSAGCAMSMAMKREYSDFFQCVTGSVKGAIITPQTQGTAARAATTAFANKAPPIGVGRPKYAEILAVTLLHMDDYDLRCYGATCIARLAVSQRKRKEAIVILGGVDLLIEQLDRSSNREQFTEFATQAVLNLSTHGPNQEYICSCARGVGLRRMLNMVKDPSRPRCATYAQAVLSNVARHPANRTRLYRAELNSTIDVM
jgi:hypothetical protein